jgi:predicted SAM-dependent methyltransferase
MPHSLQRAFLAMVNPTVKFGLTTLKLRVASLVGKYRCSVCGSRVSRFGPLSSLFIEEPRRHGFKYATDESETCNADNYSCPFCGAADRDRLYALYIQEHFPEISARKAIRIVDFAPSEALSAFIRKLISASPQTFSYRTADLFMQGVDDRVDITDMFLYEDNSVDFFICSHVLEHVADDRKALSELYRVLNDEGQGILVVPIVLTADQIDEDPSVTDVAERWRRFGQDDHVRLYSKEGFISRVQEAGFRVQQLGEKHFGKDMFERYGITERSVLYVVGKA